MKTLRRGSFARNNFTFWCIALICFFFCFVAAAILTSCVNIALRPNETINNKFSLLMQISNMKIRILELLCKTEHLEHGVYYPTMHSRQFLFIIFVLRVSNRKRKIGWISLELHKGLFS